MPASPGDPVRPTGAPEEYETAALFVASMMKKIIIEKKKKDIIIFFPDIVELKVL